LLKIEELEKELETAESDEANKKKKNFWDDKLRNEFEPVVIPNEENPAAAKKSKDRQRKKQQDIEEDIEVNMGYNICGKIVADYTDLRFIITDEYKKLIEMRQDLVRRLNIMKKHSVVGRNEMVRTVAECHLRKGTANGTATASVENHRQCQLCSCDYAFKAYARYLFSSSDDEIKVVQENKDAAAEETILYNI
jgi:hypothetical protein